MLAGYQWGQVRKICCFFCCSLWPSIQMETTWHRDHVTKQYACGTFRTANPCVCCLGTEGPFWPWPSLPMVSCWPLPVSKSEQSVDYVWHGYSAICMSFIICCDCLFDSWCFELCQPQGIIYQGFKYVEGRGGWSSSYESKCLSFLSALYSLSWMQVCMICPGFRGWK